MLSRYRQDFRLRGRLPPSVSLVKWCVSRAVQLDVPVTICETAAVAHGGGFDLARAAVDATSS